MSAVACDIEVSERQRACNVAGAMLQPARIIGRRRYRAARASTCLSCLRDSILICAHRARLSSLVGDLSVVRRDVVHAGCVASKRAHCNFNILQRLLRRHHANILILSEKDGTVVQHISGDSVGRCIGNIYWDVSTRHVSAMPMVPYSFDTNTNPPWFSSVVGGKRPKSKAKAKAAKKSIEAPADNHAEAVFEIMQHRLHMPHNSQTCMARTFRLFQCAHKASAMLPSGIGVCGMHVRTWRKHALMTNITLSHAHEADLIKYLATATKPKDKYWSPRHI